MILGSHVNRPKQYNLQSVGVKNQINFFFWNEKTRPHVYRRLRVGAPIVFVFAIDTVLLLFLFFLLSLCFLSFSYVPIPPLTCSSFSLYTIFCVPSSPYTCRLGSGDFFLSHLAPPGSSLQLPPYCFTAASLLFRYHLHINAARELVER